MQKTLGRWTDRPAKDCKQVIDAVVMRVVDALAAEGIADEQDGSGPVEPSIRDMIEDEGLDEDGYHYARWLETNCGWDADMRLAEILDDVSLKAHRIHGDMVREWAKGWEPEFKVGDQVKTQLGVGDVRAVRREEAQYVVWIDGECDGRPGETGVIFNAEDCERE